MRRVKQPKGFTIIEVSLFLAVSGFLLLITVFGMGSVMKQQQFRSSMNSVESYINQQYNDIQTGVSNRRANIACSASGMSNVSIGDSLGSVAGSSENCMLAGRYYELSTLDIKASDVVGKNDDNCQLTSSDISKLSEATCFTKVTGTNNSAQGIKFSWGNVLQSGRGRAIAVGDPENFGYTAVGYKQIDGFGIYRDTSSGEIFIALHEAGGGYLPSNEYRDAQFCFKGQASYYGAIYFGSGHRSGDVSGGNNLASVKIDDSSCGS